MHDHGAAVIIGLDMVTSSADFIKDTCSSQKRASMVIAARLLLTDIARLLIIADRIDVDLFVSAVNKVNSIRTGVLQCTFCRRKAISIP
jgi:hypothetical protein